MPHRLHPRVRTPRRPSERGQPVRVDRRRHPRLDDGAHESCRPRLRSHTQADRPPLPNGRGRAYGRTDRRRSSLQTASGRRTRLPIYGTPTRALERFLDVRSTREIVYCEGPERARLASDRPLPYRRVMRRSRPPRIPTAPEKHPNKSSPRTNKMFDHRRLGRVARDRGGGRRQRPAEDTAAGTTWSARERWRSSVGDSPRGGRQRPR